jgi:hypothetical protein
MNETSAARMKTACPTVVRTACEAARRSVFLTMTLGSGRDGVLEFLLSESAARQRATI